MKRYKKEYYAKNGESYKENKKKIKHDAIDLF